MNPIRRNIFLMVFMFAAAAVALAFQPTHRIADDGEKVNLEAMIPKQFGEWTLDDSIAPLKVSADVEANLQRIYNQTLSRTYINRHGDQIMLSIAYGSDQSTTLQVHRPDVCYTAQGFLITNIVKDLVQTLNGSIPVMHMVANQGQRIEPITYWITVGDIAVRGWFEQKLAKVQYGLTGAVPSGILVRVSNISSDEQYSYKLHTVFINEMLKAIKQGDQLRLLGNLYHE